MYSNKQASFVTSSDSQDFGSPELDRAATVPFGVTITQDQ